MTYLSTFCIGLTALTLIACQSIEHPVGDDSDFHHSLLTLDTHVDIDQRYMLLPEFDPNEKTKMAVDFSKMTEGGFDAGFFVVYVGQAERTPKNYAEAKLNALRKFDAIHSMVAYYPEQIGFATTPNMVEKLVNSGKKVAMIGIENGFVIGKNLALVDEFYQRGARYLGLTHVGHNDLCDSSNPKPELGDKESEHEGISELGQQVVKRMNELGMMIDISHASIGCVADVLRLSQAPIIASHSSSYHLANTARNLTDSQLQAIAAQGGVVQAVAFSGYVKVDSERLAAFEQRSTLLAQKYGDQDFSFKKHAGKPEFTQLMQQLNQDFPRASVQDYVNHIQHMVEIMGINHVGISSDFGGGGGLVGWGDASETENITIELLKRGFSKKEIKKIWSGNLLRVWGEIERVGQQLQLQQ